MNKPHKHAELIIAWAKGAEIECYCKAIDKWFYEPKPNWVKSLEYRVKPKVKWTPKYMLITAYMSNKHRTITVPKKVHTYDTINQFVSEFETDWVNQNWEILRTATGFYHHENCTYSLPSVCAIRMSKECAIELCEMLNNKEIEL